MYRQALLAAALLTGAAPPTPSTGRIEGTVRDSAGGVIGVTATSRAEKASAGRRFLRMTRARGATAIVRRSVARRG